MKPTLLFLARVGVGLLFLWAVVGKVPDLRAFAEDIANYQLVPAPLVGFVTVAFLGVELVTALLLVTGAFARAAATVVALMLVAFTLALAQALLRGIDLRCGCFGGADAATWLTVLRDLALLVPTLAVARFGGGRWALGPDATQRGPGVA